MVHTDRIGTGPLLAALATRAKRKHLELNHSVSHEKVAQGLRETGYSLSGSDRLPRVPFQRRGHG
jgi:hypothetical protein